MHTNWIGMELLEDGIHAEFVGNTRPYTAMLPLDLVEVPFCQEVLKNCSESLSPCNFCVQMSESFKVMLEIGKNSSLLERASAPHSHAPLV